MDEIEWMGIVMFLLVGVVIVLFSIAMYDASFIPSYSELCKEHGMRYRSLFDTHSCIDAIGDAHFVDRICTGDFSDTECELQFISVGEIRVD